MSEFILNLQKLIENEDNRATADIMFIVEQQRTSYGFEDDYADFIVWVNGNEEIKEGQRKFKTLEKLRDNFKDTGDWRRVGCKHYWEFVQAFFTEEGANNYLKINGHNLGKTRIFGHSGFRNWEWIGMREYILGFKEGTIGNGGSDE